MKDNMDAKRPITFVKAEWVPQGLTATTEKVLEVIRRLVLTFEVMNTSVE